MSCCSHVNLRVVVVLVGVTMLSGVMLAQQEYKSGKVWPEPKVITPGKTDDAAPSDAIVLFDGKDLSAWSGGDRWRIEDGVATVRGGDIETKKSFGDCQLHIEWAAPEKVSGSGQGRGNSGVYFMKHYEIQVLDSFNNETYPDGSAAALYKQSPPLVNACRKPGEWQTYDIIFIAPRFKDGKLAKPGHVTVFHNGVLAQNHTEIEGTTAWDRAPAYEPHAEKLPLLLQNHGNPVRYRNIWIREL
jgi:hypothetical protein